MIPRLLELPTEQSILLFGPRGTGKSTLLHAIFPLKETHWINLLDLEEEQHFSSQPNDLIAIVKSLPETVSYVVIDEIQKIPSLLDVVHLLIESTNKKFILTGSSARKLKRGGANLLAGRAFVYHLFPFSFLELKEQFDLNSALRFGTQPKVITCPKESDKIRYLLTYASTYLKEEIAAEQLVKKLPPFRRFLEVAAQSNGKIVNYANIARDTKLTDVTVSEYFSILEDTLLGFFLEPFQSSFRKRLSQKPKFYFFDTGVVRALSRTLSIPLLPQTTAYGEVFEHFVITEAIKLASYFFPEFRFSYLRTKDDAEIDLIVERPGEPLLCIEIKSASFVGEEALTMFSTLTADLPESEAVCFCCERTAKRYGHVSILPWQEGLKKYFTGIKNA